MKNSMQIDVERFMEACGQTVYASPLIPTADVVDLRISLMYEELMGTGELVDSMQKSDLVGVADGIADLLYVVIGTAAAYGINAQEIFNEVQRSNMTKVMPDGSVHKREDGKILKPDTFSPADIKSIIERQIVRTRW